jgi:excisionase family DNA binding protein
MQLNSAANYITGGRTLSTELLIPIPEAARLLRCSRAQMYKILATGELRHCHIGRSHRVDFESIIEYVRKLEDSECRNW